MPRLSYILQDQAFAKRGAWETFHTADGPLRLRIASSATIEFEAALRDELRPSVERAGGEVPSDDVAELATRRALARACLTGWEDMRDDDGTLIEFSVERAVELLSRPGAEALAIFVQRKASIASRFTVAAAEADAGKSEPPRSGGEHGAST